MRSGCRRRIHLAHRKAIRHLGAKDGVWVEGTRYAELVQEKTRARV